jgi:TolA-binding protein
MAQISQQSVAEDTEIAKEIMQVIAQATLFVKENMDWMNPDPTIMSTRLMTEAQEAETDRRREEDKLKHEREMQKLSAELERTREEVNSRILENESQSKAAIDRIQQLREEAMLDAKIEMWKNREDNATKLQVEAAKIAQAQLSTVVPEQKEPDINEPLRVIMQGLQSTIESTRAPRKATAIRDENGDVIGSRSEIEI